MADVLFIAAHPDDIEILAGGTVARLAAMGHSVMLADCTEGEMGTRGTVEERREEAANAARILGVERMNLKLPDGRLQEEMPTVVRRIVECIREVRPRLIFTHEHGDHHPDHNAVAEGVRFAMFQANVMKYDTGQERHKVERMFSFVGARDRWPVEPSFVVDISDYYEKKVESLKAYVSQLANPNYKGPETYVSSNAAWEAIEHRAGFFGSIVNVRYGEAFKAHQPLRINDPFVLLD